MDRKVFLALLATIIGLGAYLRLADLGGPSLWLDEILHLQVARSLSEQPWYHFLTGVREVSGRTENGPLYYALQILGLRLAPDETGVRLLPAILGVLALPLMAVTANLVGGRLVALAATFLLAVSPLHVYYSREGRPYSLLMTLAIVLLLALLRRGSRSGIWLAYGGCLLAAYTGLHAVPILLSFGVLSAMGLAWSLRERSGLPRSPYVHGLLAAVLALGLSYGLYMTRSKLNAPVVFEIKTQAGPLDRSSESWERRRWTKFKSPLTQTNQRRFVASMTTSGHMTVLPVWRSWVLLALSLVGLVFGSRRRPRETLATAGMFLLPAALSIAALLPKGRWYNISYTNAALPAFLLLVALGITAFGVLAEKVVVGRLQESKCAGLKWATVGILLLLFVAPNATAARQHPNLKADWRGVARFFDTVALEGEPVLVTNGWPKVCLEHYLQELGRTAEFINLRETADLGEKEVAKRSKGWLLTAGFQKRKDAKSWMQQFVPVLKMREEELALYFFPDLATLLETRFAADKGEIFTRRFAEMGHRFDFSVGETLLQGRGWSYAERNKAEIEFQWAVGEQAELGLPIGTPRDAIVRLRALPFTYREAPPQTVEVRLNKESLATLRLPKGWSEHEVEVPAESWSTGANTLVLRFGRSTVPSQLGGGSTDHRALSVAFDFLQVVTEDSVTQ